MQFLIHKPKSRHSFPEGGWGETMVLFGSDGQFYLLSAIDRPFARETMLFACDREGAVTDWADLRVWHSSDIDAAYESIALGGFEN